MICLSILQIFLSTILAQFSHHFQATQALIDWAIKDENLCLSQISKESSFTFSVLIVFLTFLPSMDFTIFLFTSAPIFFPV